MKFAAILLGLMSLGGAQSIPSEEERAPVRLPLCIYDECSFVDETGEKVLTGFSEIEPFAENGLALVDVDGEGKKFIDTDGNTVISLPPRWLAHSFRQGLARVQIYGEGYTFIDNTGEPITDLRFKDASDFDSAGMAVVADEDHYGVLDRNGNLIVPFRLGFTTPFSTNGLAVSWSPSGRTVGYIDRTGEWAFEPAFSNASSFRDNGYATVSMDGWDYVLSSNGLLTRKDIAERREFTRFGMYPAADPETGLYGYKNIDGDWAIAPNYDYALDFEPSGIARIRQKGEQSPRSFRFGFIDTEGNWIAEPGFADLCRSHANGIIGFTPWPDPETPSHEESRRGFMNLDGEEILPNIFENCGVSLDDRYTIVNFGFSKDYFGVVDNEGNMYGFTEEDVLSTAFDGQTR